MQDLLKLAEEGGLFELPDGGVMEVPSLDGLGDVELAQAIIAFMSRCDARLGGNETVRKLINAFEGWLAGTVSTEDVETISLELFADTLMSSVGVPEGGMLC